MSRPDGGQADVTARLAAQIAAIQARGGGQPATSAPALPEGGSAALAFLVRATSQRPLTVAEAADKLHAKDLPDDVIEAVVAQAVALRLLDDEGFARAWVEDRGAKRGYGQQRLRRELLRRKVPDDVVEAALAALDRDDEVAQATDLARARAQRMPASLEPHKVAQRLVGFLVRRGFPTHVAHDVARRVTAMDRDWD